MKFRLIFVSGLSLMYLFGGCKEKPAAVQPAAVPLAPEACWVRSDGQVLRNDTLEKIVARDSFPAGQSLEIIRAFASVFDVRKLVVGTSYCLYHDSTGSFQRFDYFAEPERTIHVEYDSSTGWRGRVTHLPLIKKIKGVRGRITGSLYESMLAAGESAELIILFSDVFQWDLDFFSDPKQGDEYALLCEAYHLADPSQPDSLGAFVRYGRILAGEYLQKNRRLAAVYFQTSADRGGYYDLSGHSFQKTFLKSPLSYGRVTSRFSGGRRHPILKVVRPHYAIDIAAPAGTPVMASADGTVIEKGYNSGIGYFIKIRHKNSHFITLYGHLSRFTAELEVGHTVRQRDVIGYVGSTGLATGPHLHYVFYENGRPINPEKIKNSSGDPLPVLLKPAFTAVRDQRMQQLAAVAAQPSLRDSVTAVPSAEPLDAPSAAKD
ncbi:M23 family metallopeptidase [bacterium]|nr:M23 family metallopeptidase [bacterium]